MRNNRTPAVPRTATGNDARPRFPAWGTGALDAAELGSGLFRVRRRGARFIDGAPIGCRHCSVRGVHDVRRFGRNKTVSPMGHALSAVRRSERSPASRLGCRRHGPRRRGRRTPPTGRRVNPRYQGPAAGLSAARCLTTRGGLRRRETLGERPRWLGDRRVNRGRNRVSTRPHRGAGCRPLFVERRSASAGARPTRLAWKTTTVGFAGPRVPRPAQRLKLQSPTAVIAAPNPPNHIHA